MFESLKLGRTCSINIVTFQHNCTPTFSLYSVDLSAASDIKVFSENEKFSA